MMTVDRTAKATKGTIAEVGNQHQLAVQDQFTRRETVVKQMKDVGAKVADLWIKDLRSLDTKALIPANGNQISHLDPDRDTSVYVWTEKGFVAGGTLEGTTDLASLEILRDKYLVCKDVEMKKDALGVYQYRNAILAGTKDKGVCHLLAADITVKQVYGQR